MSEGLDLQNRKKRKKSSKTAKILTFSRKSHYHIETFFWVGKRFRRR